MKVIIAGTRTITDYELVRKAIEDSGWKDEITEIVCGASREEIRKKKLNVDILGAIWAEYHSIPVQYFPADWYVFGKAAGPIRNEQMAAYADALILIWDGTSPGSKNMKKNAKKYRLPKYEMVIETPIFTHETEENDHSGTT